MTNKTFAITKMAGLAIYLVSSYIFPLNIPLSQRHHVEPIEIKEAFIKAVNSSAIAPLYSLFNDAMKKRNTQKHIDQNLSQISDQIGVIKSLELIDESEGIFVYRSIHKKSSLKVVFEIDDACLLSKMSIEPYTYEQVPKLERNISKLLLPFNEEWYVFWGGMTVSDNYHNAYPNMVGAFDFWVMGSNGKSHKNNARTNDEFYAFGKEIIAPTDGTITLVLDEVPDNNWPSMNKKAGFGNTVILETVNEEYILFAHLKHHSIRVREGDKVSQGQVLGLCGNSGNSTEPHLHLQMQNVPDLMSGQSSHMYFEAILVNGILKKDYSPRRREKISNLR